MVVVAAYVVLPTGGRLSDQATTKTQTCEKLGNKITSILVSVESTLYGSSNLSHR